jgi:hypothetical protein
MQQAWLAQKGGAEDGPAYVIDLRPGDSATDRPPQ